MMVVLRYLLLTITAICFVTLSYEIWNSLGEGIFPWGAYGLWASLILNFIYLIWSAPSNRWITNKKSPPAKVTDGLEGENT